MSELLGQWYVCVHCCIFGSRKGGLLESMTCSSLLCSYIPLETCLWILPTLRKYQQSVPFLHSAGGCTPRSPWFWDWAVRQRDLACGDLDLCFQFLELHFVRSNIIWTESETAWMYFRSWSGLRTHTGQKLPFLLRGQKSCLVFS